jgi:hypothetical protein
MSLMPALSKLFIEYQINGLFFILIRDFGVFVVNYEILDPKPPHNTTAIIFFFIDYIRLTKVESLRVQI